MDKQAESKLNNMLLRVASYIENREDTRDHTSATVGKKLYNGVIWWLAEINREKP